jgi:hydroxyacylglutathione hydrolase
MIFKQFYLESLGHASYFVGSEETGDALVLDVRRDVDIYLEQARSQSMRIRYALDTHQHNDFLTGICELPPRGGDVQLLASARAELGYRVKPLTDGARIEMGEVVFEVLETPGHTPEHISLLVTDRSRGDEPALLLSGGALLVGDVARPDLLGGREETEKHAAEMCQMLQEKILMLPDFVEVYPTHVAGSLCGGSIGSRLSTTIGYERRTNQVLTGLDAKDTFVKNCLDLKDLPAVPPYWPRMRKRNQQGPPLLGTLPEPTALSPDAFEKKADDGAVVLDCRSAEAFAAHTPKALNVGIGSSFATWAGTVLPPDIPIILVLEDSRDLWEVCWQLLRIGYDIPEGWLAGGMFAWRTAAKPIEMLPQIDVWQLRRKIENGDGALVIDVRQPKEWHAGHIRDAVHITGAEFPKRIGEIPKDRPVALVCGSGYRSSVAASLLQAVGHTEVFNILGGMTAWKKAGFPTVSQSSS